MTLFSCSPEKGGQLDELTVPYQLIRVTEGRKTFWLMILQLAFFGVHQRGKMFDRLSAENLIDVETGKKTRHWISIFPE